MPLSERLLRFRYSNLVVQRMASAQLSDFTFRELEAGPRRDIARRFADFAYDVNRLLPDGDEKEGCITMLLEARNCAVRSTARQLRQTPKL